MIVIGRKPFVIVPVNLRGNLPSVGALRMLEPLAPRFIVEHSVEQAYSQREAATMLQFMGEAREVHGVAPSMDYVTLPPDFELNYVAATIAASCTLAPVLLASEATVAALIEHHQTGSSALNPMGAMIAQPLQPSQYNVHELPNLQDRRFELPKAKCLLKLLELR